MFSLGAHGIDLEWEEDEVETKPGTDHSQLPVHPNTPCYLCGPPYAAKIRLKGGHPLCERCLKRHARGEL